MMPPPGLQIRPSVTLTFDLVIPEIDRLMPLSINIMIIFKWRTMTLGQQDQS